MRLPGKGSTASHDDAFAPIAVLPGEEPLFPPAPAIAPVARRRRWPYAVALAGILIVAGGASGGWYWSTRGPDLGAFDAGLANAVQVAGRVQTDIDGIGDKGSPSGLAVELRTNARGLASLQLAVQDVSPTKHRIALMSVVLAGQEYIEELERVVAIPPSRPLAGELTQLPRLAGALNAAVRNAGALNSRDSRVLPTADPGALVRRLTARRTAWVMYTRRVASVRRANKARAAQLEAVRSFTGQFDGVIGRYSAARNDLARWIDKVNTQGATFIEAYQVLGQQAALRQQLRDEASRLGAPSLFASDRTATLAIMDHAIAATEAASRGVAEYQYDDSYAVYDESPGWLEFEAASTEISGAYTTAISNYDAHKKLTFERLARKQPLPPPPR